MIAFLQRVFRSNQHDDLELTEGLYADQYPESDDPRNIRAEIRRSYRARWTEPGRSPLTHPWLFDPCDPPQGWRYDPYYECWITYTLEK